jgi:hypothetical protein
MGSATVTQGGQASVPFAAVPGAVTVDNTGGTTTSFWYVWLYPSAIQVTPVLQAFAQNQQQPFDPPAPINGVNALTFMIWNTGPTVLQLTW